MDRYISIHSARVGGDAVCTYRCGCRQISIHSARVGGDIQGAFFLILARNFNPLRPCGRRQSRYLRFVIQITFQSTPPVWAETYRATASRLSSSHFNPLRPCGRRLVAIIHYTSLPKISIHSARVGGDRRDRCQDQSIGTFQSTPPVWAETPLFGASSILERNFNPLRPCGRRLVPVFCRSETSGISIHSARVGGD